MMTSLGSDSFIYGDPEDAAALRTRIRSLIDEHLPPHWLGPFTKDPADLAMSNRFCEILADEGLLVPDWPARYGGQDLDLASSIVIREEMWAHFEPRGGQYYGPNWVGPSIFDYGTEDQKKLHLPLIASGRAIWCQGFSEPDAGSDLANLKTTAVPDGDGFRITGQKVWTSWALWAEWCYLLARIDGSPVGKSEGVTVFLIPMNREGMSVRGLDGIPGPHHLNEVFLDGVWASRSEVLGEVGNGWNVMRDALSNERVGIARYARDDRLISKLLEDPAMASALPPGRWLQVRVRNRMSRLMCRRALWFQTDGGSHDFIVSAARMMTTRTNLLTADTLAEALGDEFFDDRHTQGAPVDGAVEFFWRYMQAGPIASGTTEMLQRHLSRTMFRGERIRVTDEGSEMRTVFDRVMEDVGSVDAARRAISEPASRAELLALVDPVLQSLDPQEGYFEGVFGRRNMPWRGRRRAPASDRGHAIEAPFGSSACPALGPREIRTRRPLFRMGRIIGRREDRGDHIGPRLDRIEGRFICQQNPPGISRRRRIAQFLRARPAPRAELVVRLRARWKRLLTWLPPMPPIGLPLARL